MTLADLATYVGLLLAIAAVLLSPLALSMRLNDIACRRQEAAGPTPLDTALKALLNAYKEGDHV